MKFVLASYGTRGDVEPGIALGRELLGRGHDVCMAVPPDLVGVAEAAGLAAVAYGPDAQRLQDVHWDFLRSARSPWRVRDLMRGWREDFELFTRCWKEMSTALKSLAEGADLLLVVGVLGEDAAVSVAEYYDIPLVTVHTFPMRANGQLLSFLPAALGRYTMTVSEWLGWPMSKKFEDAQRHELGLPKAASPPSRRISERGSLEIQAYDEVCFPGLAAEWAKFDGHRPFVGALTMESPTDADEDVMSWIAEGTPPIYFGFGSNPVESPADTLAMISAACAQLGERALICAGWSDFGNVSQAAHVKVVSAMSHAVVFPECRAVVHHGGAGTAAAALRAGVPQLILSTWWLHQPLWGGAVNRLKVGTARRFSSTTQQSLAADLRTILAPQYVARAREVAAQMNKPAESVAAAADLVEKFAR